MSGTQQSNPSVAAAVRTLAPSPVGLTVTKSTWTSVTLRWAPSPLGPVPGQYDIYSDGIDITTVPGSVDTYTVNGLTTGGATSSFQVVARWGSASSSRSAALTGRALSAPLSGSVPLTVDTLTTPGNGASLSVGEHWGDTWQFTANCTSTGCALIDDGELAAPKFAERPFTVTLHGSGGSYSGTTTASITTCISTRTTDTVSVSLTPRGAVTNGAWSTWKGSMTVAEPYTTVGDEYCPASSWTFSLTGNS